MNGAELENADAVTGDLVEETETLVEPRAFAPTANEGAIPLLPPAAAESNTTSSSGLYYVFLPILFLTVALLGGLRLMTPDNAFSFWWPPLFCLIAAAMLMALFVKTGLLRIGGWFSEDFGSIENIANGAILVTVFAATAQVFNSLIPERGMWSLIVSFFFFWTLATNFFGAFDPRTFLRFMGATCGLAFVFKYIFLLNITAPAGKTLLESLADGLVTEMATRLFGLVRFSAGTAYIQFFTVAIYLIGLFVLPNSPSRPGNSENR